jgi:choline dehydrogenase-like flavoprotein
MAAQRGNSGWSFEDVLPYFRRAEHGVVVLAGEHRGASDITIISP